MRLTAQIRSRCPLHRMSGWACEKHESSGRFNLGQLSAHAPVSAGICLKLRADPSKAAEEPELDVPLSEPSVSDIVVPSSVELAEVLLSLCRSAASSQLPKRDCESWGFLTAKRRWEKEWAVASWTDSRW